MYCLYFRRYIYATKKMDEKKFEKFSDFFCEIIFSKGNLFLNVLLHFETILSKKMYLRGGGEASASRL